MLSCLVAVFCLAKVNRFCFDRSVVITRYRGHRLHHPLLPPTFYCQCLPFPFVSEITTNIVFLVMLVVQGRMANLRHRQTNKHILLSTFLTLMWSHDSGHWVSILSRSRPNWCTSGFLLSWKSLSVSLVAFEKSLKTAFEICRFYEKRIFLAGPSHICTIKWNASFHCKHNKSVISS